LHYLLVLLLPTLLFSKPFKVASYNVENLFDATFQGNEYEEYIPGKHNWNARTVEIKLNNTAEVICDLNADILGLQEIENEHILHRLQKRLKSVGCSYPYSAITSKRGAPIQVALLSKYPIKAMKELRVSYAPKVRNILEVDVKVQGHRLKIFVNHWKSKAYRGVESKRIAYAKRLQKRISELLPHQEYIVLGDFNSDHNAYMTLEKKHDDTRGKTGFSDILHTKVREDEMLHAGKGIHYTLWYELPAEERWSHKFYGKKSSLDQIALPQTMFDKKGIDYVNDSFRAFKDDYLFTKRGYINRWRYKHGKHLGKGYSDHLPVYAYFDTKPYEADRNAKVLGPVVKDIEYLYTKESLNEEVILKDVVVVFKRRNNAVIKQSKKGRGIYLYGCAGALKEGYMYDLQIESIKRYKGLKEVTTAYILKERAKTDINAYLYDENDLLNRSLKQNEIIRDIRGTYKNGALYLNGKKYPVHFRNKKLKPENGAKLKIDYAHLGYYKVLQLVLYSKKDFKVLED
jgi:endonuclease/exonuclease/phosphatase family metal-dependent hydrolase